MDKLMMRSSIVAIVMALLLSMVESIHLKGHYRVSHQVSQLGNIQEAIMKHINEFNQNSQKNSNKILQTTTVEEKIAVMEAYLQQQRSLLLNIIEQSSVDLNNTNYACSSLTQADKGALSQFNQAILSDIQDLSKTKPSLGADKDQNKVSNEIKEMLNYVNTVNLPIYAKNIESSAKNTFISNINSGSYILEGSTVPGADSKQQNSEVCPYESPVAKSTDSCIACPSESPYFVVDNSSCIACESYDEAKRQCKRGDLFFTNLQAGNTQILLADSEKIENYQINQQNLPLCPAQMPFYSGKSCIACSDKLYFSLKDKSCQTCPSGKFYNIFTQKCQIQLYFSNLNNLQWETNTKQIDDVLESITIARSNESYTSCPIDLPFALEDKCIRCQNGTHFSYDSLSCVKCSSDTQLDLNMHKCLHPGNLNFQTNPLNATNLIYNGRSQNEWMNIYYRNVQEYSGIADCPQELPNFDGLACISCPHSHPYFNLELMVCQTCEGTTLYDESQHQCVTNNENRPVQTPSWEKMAAVVFSS